MDRQLLESLADPHDGLPLELHSFEEDNSETREGVLLNISTRRWYPIRDGIPSLFIDALREDNASWTEKFAKSLTALGCKIDVASSVTNGTASTTDLTRIETERKARDEQAEQYDQLLAIKLLDFFERPAYRRALQRNKSTLLLEAGCGTGRFTSLFAELASAVVAVDMSRDSILRNRVRNSGKTASPVYYVHADLTHLPLRDGLFGQTAHVGVYEHIPSHELRQQFLQHARRTLRPDGVLLLSAYRYGGVTKFFEKEGEHAGGIPFFRFTEAELRAEVEPYFEIQQFKANLGIYMSMLVARPRAA